ncbi:MAG: DUF5662 family protein [Lachnospiraceae bacterium]|jgi:hypothetical protein|nr:DUF5662 family protein [Lachnospiraceae bacterium]
MKTNNYWNHFKTITMHKWEVFKLCCKFGIVWRGFVHDLSKYTPREFLSSAKYFQGYRSPIEAEKEANGYSLAWLHHKGVNLHHWQHWYDWDNVKPCAVRMPMKYIYELVADSIAAGKVYNKADKREWNIKQPYNYYKEVNRKHSEGKMEFVTRMILDHIYVDIMNCGIDEVAKRIRKKYYQNMLPDIKDKDGREVIDNIVEYNKLVQEYYN